jgi:hypothetical protein
MILPLRKAFSLTNLTWTCLYSGPIDKKGGVVVVSGMCAF